jgi:hypothetical protein
MFLADKSPQMLPTRTLNVTVGRASPTTIHNPRRDVGVGFGISEQLNKNVFTKSREPVNTGRWWWLGVIMTSIGGVVLIYS